MAGSKQMYTLVLGAESRSTAGLCGTLSNSCGSLFSCKGFGHLQGGDLKPVSHAQFQDYLNFEISHLEERHVHFFFFFFLMSVCQLSESHVHTLQK